MTFVLYQTNLILLVFSYSSEDNWHSKRSEVSKVSILVLMKRCESIFKQFLTDENDLGNPGNFHTFFYEAKYLFKEYFLTFKAIVQIR